MSQVAGVRCGLARLERASSLVPFFVGIHVLQRGEWIVCRTANGLRLGRYIAECCDEEIDGGVASVTAKCVRRATPEDRWLWEKLVELNRECVEPCQAFLSLHHVDDVLVEIESSLDCRHVAFHYLDEPSPRATELHSELLRVYERSVSESDFATRIREGCGPSCGEGGGCSGGGGGSSAGGCGSGGCSTGENSKGCSATSRVVDGRVAEGGVQ
jgi:uncharacterized membrane protein YgcG